MPEGVTLLIRTPRALSDQPAVLIGIGGIRLFTVEGALVLSAVELRNGGSASIECGGAVWVGGGADLIAQNVTFMNNLARRGGALCVERGDRASEDAVTSSECAHDSDDSDSTTVQLLAVNFVENRALVVRGTRFDVVRGNMPIHDGSDIRFGYPAGNWSLKDEQLQGIQTTAAAEEAITPNHVIDNALLSNKVLSCRKSCGANTICETWPPCSNGESCASTRGIPRFTTCSCTSDSGIAHAPNAEEWAIAPYSEDIVDSFLAETFSTRETDKRSKCETLLRPISVEHMSSKVKVSLQKGGQKLEVLSKEVNLTFRLDGVRIPPT